MLKSLITYQKAGIFFLLMSLLIQTFNKPLLMGDYYLNTARYAKDCENKARIWMHCDGKCQLAKLIKKQQEEEKKNQEKRNGKQNEFYCFNSYSAIFQLVVIYPQKRMFYSLPDIKTVERPRTIFKPPIC